MVHGDTEFGIVDKPAPTNKSDANQPTKLYQ